MTDMTALLKKRSKTLGSHVTGHPTVVGPLAAFQHEWTDIKWFCEPPELSKIVA